MDFKSQETFCTKRIRKHFESLFDLDKEDFEPILISDSEDDSESESDAVTVLESRSSNYEELEELEVDLQHDSIEWYDSYDDWSCGDFICLKNDEIGQIAFIGERKARRKAFIHFRKFIFGQITFLEEEANAHEVFDLNTCLNFTLDKIKCKVKVNFTESQPTKLHEKELFCRYNYDETVPKFTKVTERKNFNEICPSCEVQRKNEFCLLEPLITITDSRLPTDSWTKMRRGNEIYQKNDAILYEDRDKPILEIGIITTDIVSTRNELYVTVRYMQRQNQKHEGSLAKLYWTKIFKKIKIDSIKGKCYIKFCQTQEEIDNWIYNGEFRFYFNECFEDQAICEVPHEAKIYQLNLKRHLKYETFGAFPNIMPLRGLALFSGCGGFSQGLLESGLIRLDYAVEIDEAAANSLRENHRETIVFNEDLNHLLKLIYEGDVKNFTATFCEYELPKRDEIDIIFGGSPCQVKNFRFSPYIIRPHF